MGQSLKQVTAIPSTGRASQEEEPLLQPTTSPPSLCSEPSASQTFYLANGDRISYLICSPASAPAIFLLHGCPGSRMDGLFFHSLAEKIGARIICADRPGLGFSTPSPDRKLLDDPDTVAQLALSV